MGERAVVRRTYRMGVAWLLVLGVLTIYTLGKWVVLVRDALGSEAGRYDFSSYYAAAYALRLDPRANIYDPAVLAQAGAASHTLVNPPLPYTYPPLFALLLSPFTAISFRVLSRVWLLGNAALWLCITLLLVCEVVALARPAIRQVYMTRRPYIVVTAGLVVMAWFSLLGAPAIQTFLTGQINFLVLLPLALVPVLTRRGHERWAGAMVAIAAMLKFTPAMLILYFVLRRRWVAAAWAVGVLAALSLVSIVIVGPGVFFASLAQALRTGGGDAILGHNEALLAPIVNTLETGNPTLALPLRLAEYVVLAALAIGIGVVLWRGRAARGSAPWPMREAAGYGMALCALLLLSPTAWVHHYVWVLPAAAIALGLAVAELRPAAGWRSLAVAVATVMAIVTLSYGLPSRWDTEPNPSVTEYLGLPLRPLFLLLRPLATLALLALLARWYLRPLPLGVPASGDMLTATGAAAPAPTTQATQATQGSTQG